MKIVFYSTYASVFNGEEFHYEAFPEWNSQLEQLVKKYPQHTFAVVTQKPAMFLADLSGNELKDAVCGVQYIFCESADADVFALNISSLKPDAAFAFTFWSTPYDWLTINDGLVAQKLQMSGIKTFCHSPVTGAVCFDKKNTRDFLMRHGFKCARSVYIDHNLFWAERPDRTIAYNPYKKYVLDEIRKLKLPLVIKDTTGLSSYGMEVVKTYGEAEAFLRSKKNQGNKLVEEYVSGIQAGVEIHGTKGSYVVTGGFYFSVNQYGITSPKQSVKAGPVDFSLYESELVRLAEELELCGIAQVDVVLNDEGFFIIEVNPRLSGMTVCSAAAEDKSVFDVVMEIVEGKRNYSAAQKILDLKIPVTDRKMLEEIKSLPYMKFILQTRNDAAKQHREEGYCELVFSAKDSDSLKNALDDFKTKYPPLVDEGFYSNACLLMKK